MSALQPRRPLPLNLTYLGLGTEMILPEEMTVATKATAELQAWRHSAQGEPSGCGLSGALLGSPHLQ